MKRSRIVTLFSFFATFSVAVLHAAVAQTPSSAPNTGGGNLMQALTGNSAAPTGNVIGAVPDGLAPAPEVSSPINFGMSADSALIEMERAYARKNTTRLAQLLPSISGHPLEVYGAYWELRARLESASAEEIRAFMQRWQGSYFEDRLRNDWLLLLGELGDSANFAREYPLYRMRDDAQVRCWAAAFGLERDAQTLLADWYAQKTASPACEAGAARLLAAGLITRADVLREARMAAEANQISAAQNALQLIDPYNAGQVRSVLARPKAALERSGTAPELAVLALVRHAAIEPDLTAALMETYQLMARAQGAPELSAEQIDWVYGVIGKQAAMNLSPLAPSYYAQAKNSQGWADDTQAWRVRALLRAGLANHAAAIVQAVQQMSPKAQQEPAWQYWRARALAVSAGQAGRDQAHTIYRQLAAQRVGRTEGFYEMLALEELGSAITLPPAAAPVTAAELAKVRANPGFVRAMLAINLGLRTMGVREWNYTAHLHEAGGLPAREVLAAAQMACELQMWDRCINTSERASAFHPQQRYPTPFRAQVLQYSGQAGIDAAYVYGLIRQESRFVTQARSGVGAAGLMQLMPATARWTARKIGLQGYDRSQVHDVDTNILLGVSYLSLALESFQGSKALAAAAYNAGPSRARRWREGAGTLEGAIWAENIPFTETRDYVKKVLANTTLYGALLTGKPQSLKAHLGTVGPAPVVLPEEVPNADLP